MEATRCRLDLELRVYTSRLLGRDPALVLHGGGNTSVKVRERNAIGEEVDILYVKGSSHDWIPEANRRAAGEPRQPHGRIPGARRSLFGDRAAVARWLVRDLPEKARPVGGDRGRRYSKEHFERGRLLGQLERWIGELAGNRES
jgi:hypothetical protein